MGVAFRIVGLLMVSRILLPPPVPGLVLVALFVMFSALLLPELAPTVTFNENTAWVDAIRLVPDLVSLSQGGYSFLALFWDLSCGVLIGLSLMLPVFVTRLFYAWFKATLWFKGNMWEAERIKSFDTLKIYFESLLIWLLFVVVGFEKFVAAVAPLLVLSWQDLGATIAVANTSGYVIEMLKLAFTGAGYLALPWLLISFLFDLTVLGVSRLNGLTFRSAPYKLFFAIGCLVLMLGFYVATLRQMLGANLEQLMQVQG